MKKFLQAALFLFCLSNYAQIKFEKGYYITNSNQRVECFIKNLDWKDNPTSFEFKAGLEQGEVKSTTILEVKEFGIDNESCFKRFTVKIEKSENLTNFLKKDKNPEWEEETLFLKQLVEGSANLYSYTQKNFIKYFYETKDVAIEQLVYIKYVLDNGQSNNVRYNSYFRQQLFNNVKCENMSAQEFEKIEYAKESLKKHFTKFNSCLGNNSVVSKAPENKGDFNLKITATLNNSSLSIKDPVPVYNVSTDFGSKMSYAFGGEIEYVLPFKKNKWSVFINPSYQLYKTTKTYDNNNGLTGASSADVTYKATIDYANLELPIGFRHYFFLNKTSKLFLNAAFAFNFSRSTEISFESIPTGKEEFEVKTGQNLLAGIGFVFMDRFSAEFRLSTSKTIMGSYPKWDASYSSIGLVLGYKVF